MFITQTKLTLNILNTSLERLYQTTRDQLYLNQYIISTLKKVGYKWSSSVTTHS